MKARKKAGVITVERYLGPEQRPLPPGVIVQGTDAVVDNKLHGSLINLQPGDYVRVDDPNDYYPIAKAYFDTNFDVVEG